MSDTEKNVLTETHGRVGLIRLNRPKQLNAFNDALMNELGDALLAFDADPGIGAIVLTGSSKAFAAGADIAAMKDYDFEENFRTRFISRNWETILQVRKPVIAAVEGVALGGGCEMVMMCDIVIASESARFAQPEVKLGVTPGAGGTQRLPAAVGKAKAMDWLLTGRLVSAQEAEQAGLVSRVVPAEKTLETALQVASEIAAMPALAVMAIKEAVNVSFESSLSEGVRYERRLFQAMFSTSDQKEGMSAFLEKRPANFRQR